MFEAGGHPAGTRTRSRSRARRGLERRHRLHRPQRPQLPELRSACSTSSAGPDPAGADELRRLRRRRSFRVGRAAPRHLRAPRPRRSIRDSCACSLDLVRFNREARGLIGDQRGWAVAAPFLADGGYSHYFVERLLVPQAAADVVGATRTSCGSFPRRFLADFFDNHGVLQLRGRPRWRSIAGGRGSLRRGADGAVARSGPLRTPVRARRPRAPAGSRSSSTAPPSAPMRS